MSEAKMKVLIIEPGQAPREAEIVNSLESMQKTVGGLIEAIYPYSDKVALVCNEEGKLDGLELNRALRDEGTEEIYDIVAGAFFVCGLSDDNFKSLSPALMRKYKDKFAEPEKYFIKDGQVYVL